MSKKRNKISQKELEDIVSNWDDLLEDGTFADSDSDCLKSSFCESLEQIREIK